MVPAHQNTRLQVGATSFEHARRNDMSDDRFDTLAGGEQHGTETLIRDEDSPSVRSAA